MLRSSALLLLLFGLQLAAAAANPQECFLQPSPGVQVAWPCKSTTKCYLDHLGEPKTLGEWWMAYASAVTEYCSALSSSDTGCSQDEPLCQMVYVTPIGPWEGRPMSPDAAANYEIAVGVPPPSECWPDWEGIIRHPCIGCQDYQMFRCANATQLADCDALSEYCQFWPKTAASSLRQYCWPKWLLHDMYTNQSKFAQYTYQYYGYNDGYRDQAETKVYSDHVLNGYNTAMQVWSAVSPGLGSCGHKQIVDSLLSQLASMATSDVGDILLREWHVPCMTRTQSDSYGAAYPYVSTGDNPVWPYLTSSYQSHDLPTYSAALFHVHQHLNMPWTRLPGFLDIDSSWQHRLSVANIRCANITDSDTDMCDTEASGQAIMHALTGYCRIAFNSSCEGLNFKQTTFSCGIPHGGAQLALGVIWLVFGFIMLLVIVLVESAWSIAGTLRRFIADIQFAKWKLISRGGFSRWLQRGTVCYHPAVVRQGPGGSAPAGVAAWRRVLSKVNDCILAGAYVADIGLDIWTLATIFTYSDGGQYGMLDESTRSLYGELLMSVFLSQYFLGAVLAAPAVLATHGLLDYTWFKMTPALRVLLLLPPMWGILCIIFIAFSLFVIVVGMWYLIIADFNMLLSLVGVPPRWLLGNKLNMEAVMVLRFLCEGIVEALPSALVSTAIINSQLMRGQHMGWRFAVFWLSLISSLVRVGRELYKILRLTYDLHACCFVTTIVDVCYHLQPQPVDSLPVYSSTAPRAPHASSGRNNSMLAETRSKEITAGPDAQPSFNSIEKDLGTVAGRKADGRDVPDSTSNDVGGGSTRVSSSSDQMLPQSPSMPSADGVSRRSARGCCWPGTLESNRVHPRALVIYVWVWLSLTLLGIAFLCIYVICPTLMGGGSCGADSLISVWSSFGSDVASPKDALACLTESSA